MIPPPRRHILTVALEDYFHVGAFNGLISPERWYRFSQRLEVGAENTLKLLAKYDIKATFFVLGWVAERFPELVERIANSGHEIASKGYRHRSIREATPEEFRLDAIRSREALEAASGRKVLGYRLANGWIQPQDYWVFPILQEAGYRYDSSICPRGLTFAAEPWRRHPHRITRDENSLVELPLSTVRRVGFDVPVAGGGYFRQLPTWFVRNALNQLAKTSQGPLNLYFHTWELDPDQPIITAAGGVTRLRHYRNLGRMTEYLEYLFQRYGFGPASEYLGLSTRQESPIESIDAVRLKWSRHDYEAVEPLPAQGERKPVSIVIPCFNEETTLPYLANTLESVERRLGQRYKLTFIFVDDCSRDGTWNSLHKLFNDKPNVKLLRHDKNKGVTGAIMTGIRAAEDEIVCSMDCDCSYDPHKLADMIPQLKPGIDLVTASPYHPEGEVRNVPAWRLSLSKSASWCYRRVLRHKLHTYTSCFRVHRRSRFLNIQPTHSGYLGVVESLAILDQQGGGIVEYPATLESRLMGHSKMKTLRVILGHLKLLARLRWNRKPAIEGERRDVSPPVAMATASR